MPPLSEYPPQNRQFRQRSFFTSPLSFAFYKLHYKQFILERIKNEKTYFSHNGH